MCRTTHGLSNHCDTNVRLQNNSEKSRRAQSDSPLLQSVPAHPAKQSHTPASQAPWHTSTSPSDVYVQVQSLGQDNSEDMRFQQQQNREKRVGHRFARMYEFMSPPLSQAGPDQPGSQRHEPAKHNPCPLHKFEQRTGV